MPSFSSVKADRYRVPPQGPARLLEQVSWLMDRSIRIPGTRFTIGLDAILGLLPIGGDVLTGIVQVGIVLLALYHYRVPKAVAARMAANVLLDTSLGALPVVGDVFDAFFKANTRNMQLLNQVQELQQRGEPVPAAPSVIYLVSLAALLLGVLFLVLIGFITVITWLIRRPIV
jgi:hypothetical protein